MMDINDIKFAKQYRAMLVNCFFFVSETWSKLGYKLLFQLEL